MNCERLDQEAVAGGGTTAVSHTLVPAVDCTYSVVGGKLVAGVTGGALDGLDVWGEGRITSITEDTGNSRWEVIISHGSSFGRYRYGYEAATPAKAALFFGWRGVQGAFDISLKFASPATAHAQKAIAVGAARASSQSSGAGSGFVGSTFGGQTDSLGEDVQVAISGGSRYAASAGVKSWTTARWQRFVRDSDGLLHWYDRVDDADPWVERTGIDDALDVVGDANFLGVGFGTENNQSSTFYVYALQASWSVAS